MNIYEIVEGGQVVVLGNEDLGILISWNGNSMLNLWVRDYSVGNWDNKDVRTRYDIEGNLDKAIAEAQEWLSDLEEEL